MVLKICKMKGNSLICHPLYERRRHLKNAITLGGLVVKEKKEIVSKKD